MITKSQPKPELCVCYANAKAHLHVEGQVDLERARTAWPHVAVVHEPVCDCMVCFSPTMEMGMEGL